MVYDPSLVTDISKVNEIVSIIRTGNANSVPGSSKRLLVRNLVRLMNLETCERILNEVLHPNWIRHPLFNALTTSDLVKLISVKREAILYSIQAIPDSDKKLVKFSEIEDLVPVREGKGYRPHSIYILNARAILYAMVTMLNHSEKCKSIFDTLYDSICRDENWILPYPAEPVGKAVTDEAVKKITRIITEPAEDPDTISIQPARKINLKKPVKPKPAAKPHDAPESAILGFLNHLKPGTEIKIVVPA